LEFAKLVISAVEQDIISGAYADWLVTKVCIGVLTEDEVLELIYEEYKKKNNVNGENLII
jgi:hypothetical protein